MIRVVAVVEGPTEQAFVSRVLAVHLAPRGVNITSILSGKSGKQGGVPRWEPALRDMVRVLRQGAVCSTMFDFYGMRFDWPGRREATELPVERRGEHVESALAGAVEEAMGRDFDARRFLPYVQMHEFEALVFADPEVLAARLSRRSGRPAEPLGKALQAIVEEAGGPERIDDGYETCPSRRLGSLAAGYSKTLVGPTVTQEIGVERLRAECGHFDRWLLRLEALAE